MLGENVEMPSVLSHSRGKEAGLFSHQFSICSLLKTSSKSISSLAFLVCQPCIPRLVPRPFEWGAGIIGWRGYQMGSVKGPDLAMIEYREGQVSYQAITFIEFDHEFSIRDESSMLTSQKVDKYWICYVFFFNNKKVLVYVWNQY